MWHLFPFIHLYLHSMTRIVVDGREVLIQKNPRCSMWRISTCIFEGRGEFPKETQECLQLIQQLKWESKGVLEVDAVIGAIHWTQEVRPFDFRKELPLFLKHAREWAEVLAKELV